MKHPTAVIHEATRIPESVTVGPYAVIEDGVELGENCLIDTHAVIKTGTILGSGCQVGSHSVLGGAPQDLNFDPKVVSGVKLGNNVVMRESVTIHRAAKDGEFTILGDDCFLMVNCHIGHDCKVGNKAVLANNLLLSGYAQVGDRAFISGGAGVHQFCRIGESSIIGGVSRITMDVPPFVMVAERNNIIGLNLIGLQRRGMDRTVIKELKKLYHMVFGFDGSPKRLAQAAIADEVAQSDPGKQFLEFIAMDSKRGMCRARDAD